MSRVVLEIGRKRVFACALDVPGLARAGKTEEEALEALTTHVPRWEAATGRTAPRGSWRVVERLPGNATTDFGAPDVVAAADWEPWPPVAEESVAVLRAAWAALDLTRDTAPPVLRKGPRGGGRDRDDVVRHVLAGEAGYARKVGVKRPVPDLGDVAAIAAGRDALASALLADGRTLTGGRPWPRRYAVRRLAWHVLDHVWEIEDRSAVEREGNGR